MNSIQIADPRPPMKGAPMDQVNFNQHHEIRCQPNVTVATRTDRIPSPSRVSTAELPHAITAEQLVLLHRYATLRAKRMIRKYGHNGVVDADDVAQELFLRVWERMHHFNEAKSKWATFCELILKQGTQQIWQRQILRSRRPYDRLRGERLHPHTHAAMTRESGDEAASIANPFREWELEHDVTILISLLERNEQVVAEFLSRGSWAAAARELNISRRQLQAIARKFRTLVLQLGLLD